MTINAEKQTKIVAEEVHKEMFAETPRDIWLRKFEHASGEELNPHYHSWGQLLYSTKGLMEAITENSVWIVPAQRALWIPPFKVHKIRFIHSVNMHNLYLKPASSKKMPEHCKVVNITRLTRELIIKVAEIPRLYDEGGTEGRLVQVLLDQISTLQTAPLSLPACKTEPMLRITDAIRRDPANSRSLEAWSETMNCSPRTLARRFNKETGMTFGQWRQQARLLAAMIMLAEKKPVASIAQELGYESQSAFIAMFRRSTGTTPARYFAED